MTYVGIDLHANNMVNVAIDGNGKVIREAKLPTSRRSLEDFFGSFNGSVKVVVECTSSWYWLSDWCRTNGIALALAHSKMVKAISYAKVKTHRVDAKTLAELLMAVPGLGKVGAWTNLAEIGDIRRLLSAKQFVSYCRLVPGAKDSGGSRRHQSGNKDGNKYLRITFGQSAVSAYTHYNVVKKFYRKIKRRSGRQVASYRFPVETMRMSEKTYCVRTICLTFSFLKVLASRL